MKKHILKISFIFLFIILVIQLFAQDEDYSREKDKPGKPRTEKNSKSTDDFGSSKFIYGGGLGLQFGNPTFVELSPKLGYHLTEKSIFGGGISYIYYSIDLGSQGKNKASLYGGSLFASYEPIQRIFGWAEYEILNTDYYNNTTQSYMRKWIGSPFIGAGYREPISEKGFIQFMLLYNLNYSTESLYDSPIISRISIFF